MILKETDTNSNKDISAAVSIASYTATAVRTVVVRVLINQVAGGGDYVVYLTLTKSTVEYRIIPLTTAAAAASLTSIGFVSIGIPVDVDDVLQVYVDGLAGDNSTPDTRVDWYELDYLRPTTSGRTLDVAATGEAGLDFTNRLDTTGILPNVAAGASGGLPLSKDAAGRVEIAGTKNTLDSLSGVDADTLKTLSDQIDGINSIVGAGVPTLYAPTAATRVVGDNDGGSVASLAAHDDVSMSTGEVVGTGLEVTVVVAATDTAKVPSLVRITGYYAGSATHSVAVYLYNYSLSAWELATTMLNRNAPFDYVIPAHSDNAHAVTGEMSLRFLHNVVTYNASHALHLDWISFEKIETSSQWQSDVAAVLALVQGIDTDIAGPVALEATATAIKAATDKLDTALEVDGAVYRYTANALEQSPAAGSLTAQEVRDAMKLAPTAGAPAAGSVDKHLDDILENTGTTLPGTLATIQAKTDLITTGTALSVVSPLDGDALTIIRGDTLSVALAGLGNISTRSKLWFTLKRQASDLDAAAILQVVETTGLVVANGAAPGSAALGSLVVTNQVTGAATLTIDETVTDDLAVRAGLVWDVQVLTAAGVVTTLAGGSGAVTADVTRAVS